MKYIVRSGNAMGHRTRFECKSLNEAFELGEALRDTTGFAVSCNDGSAGTSRWKYTDKKGLLIVGTNRLILEYECERVS